MSTYPGIGLGGAIQPTFVEVSRVAGTLEESPKKQADPRTKPAPAMTILVPPATSPEVGLALSTTESGTYSKGKEELTFETSTSCSETAEK